MRESFSEAYRAAGVDIEAGYEGVRRIRKHAERTMNPGVLGGIGGFGGAYKADFSSMEEPVLISGTDGVGTKLRIACLTGRHDTIGIDLVAMCVNDIICCGAKPLFFLDYISIGRNDPAKVEDIVSGVAEGCVQAGCALIGGETAEHPGIMAEDDYDIAGFAVGLVDKKDMIDSSLVGEGDLIVALPSSGLHSNGFSLVRKVLDVENADLGKYVPELSQSLGEALLTPTRIYVKPLLEAMKCCRIHGISHITGGGFYENIPRALPQGYGALIREKDIVTPPIFGIIERAGDITRRDMFNTFNMGVGMCIIVSESDADELTESLRNSGEQPYVIGTVRKSEDRIVII